MDCKIKDVRNHNSQTLHNNMTSNDEVNCILVVNTISTKDAMNNMSSNHNGGSSWPRFPSIRRKNYATCILLIEIKY